jgi:hypothetical protein
MKKSDNVITYDPPTQSRGFLLNTEELKIDLDEIIKENNITPFLHTVFCSPVMEDNKISAVIIENKSGRSAVKAKYFIDASGDGDLAARAGFSFSKNDELQPPTTCAYLSGIDEEMKDFRNSSLNKAVFDKQYKEALKGGTLWKSEVVGVDALTLVAGTRVHHADCSEAEDLTNAEIEGRRQVRQMCNLLKNNFPECKDIKVASLPAWIGIRETRKIKCLHTLTTEEILTGFRFDDAIANGSYRVDIHHSEKSGLTFKYLDGTEIYNPAEGDAVVGRWREETDSNPTFYQIPYRSLVPENAENLLVTGRMIDTDTGAHGATRVMVNCNQTGEAAGAASYLALDSSASVKDVNTGKLRKVLADNGAIIL